jgi:radical SAM protein with 4Fe4S-binding SPASM domain
LLDNNLGINPNQRRNLNLIPYRYPFVVFRREWFGGFMFNRFLSYIKLNALQIRVLELCEGYLSIGQIKEIVRKEFKLVDAVSEQQVNNSFNLFDRYLAIHWREKRKSGIYSTPSKHSEEIYCSKNLSAPTYVLWDITYACNLNCKHCLVAAGDQKTNPLPLDVIYRIIDQLVEMKVFHINFLGGEPFMHPNIIEILTYASSFPIGVSVSTNGILVNPSLVKKLLNLNLFDIQISIDGLEETHDFFRGMIGAFAKAVEAVKLFSNAGFRTTINTVMTKLNVNEIESLVDLAISLEATSYKAVAFLPIGRGKINHNNLLLTAKQLRDNIRQLHNLQEKKQDLINIITEENYPLFHEQGLKYSTPTGFPSLGCAAGITQLVIDPYGQTFSCPFLHDFPAGNLLHKPLREIWENSEILNEFRNVEKIKIKGKCQKCEFLGSKCRGGCRASAYSVSGDLWAEDPLCWNNMT